jgi:hypothetical protein
VQTQQFWQLWQKELKTGRDLCTQRSLIEASVEATLFEGRPTSRQVKEGIRESFNALKEARAKSLELRDEFLRDRAAAAGNKNVEKALEAIRKAERLKNDWRKLKLSFRGNRSHGFSYVITPSDDPDVCAQTARDPNPDTSTWIPVYDAQKIEKLLLGRNQNHFGQADDSPWTSSSMNELFEYHGETQSAHDLLSGTLDIGAIETATRRVLRELSLPVPGIKEIDDHISNNDFEQGFKHWNEATSTSPSGRHLGHYKAILALRHLEPNEDEDGNPIETTSQLILEAITTVARIAIQKGVILDRWLNVTNVMIEKIPGKPLLNKLRVIHLFEANFNLCLRIQWGQRLMRQAESRKALGDQQFGSRKGKSSEEVVLYKVLTYELMRLTRTDGGTFDNDAKAC